LHCTKSRSGAMVQSSDQKWFGPEIRAPHDAGERGTGGRIGRTPGMMPQTRSSGNGDRNGIRSGALLLPAPLRCDWQHSSSQLPIIFNDARWISSPSGRYYFARGTLRHTARLPSPDLAPARCLHSPHCSCRRPELCYDDRLPSSPTPSAPRFPLEQAFALLTWLDPRGRNFPVRSFTMAEF
jgi:hypothetical protein